MRSLSSVFIRTDSVQQNDWQPHTHTEPHTIMAFLQKRQRLIFFAFFFCRSVVSCCVCASDAPSNGGSKTTQSSASACNTYCGAANKATYHSDKTCEQVSTAFLEEGGDSSKPSFRRGASAIDHDGEATLLKREGHQ